MSIAALLFSVYIGYAAGFFTAMLIDHFSGSIAAWLMRKLDRKAGGK
jgi:hypothetical protein